jgi:hypothetical protein
MTTAEPTIRRSNMPQIATSDNGTVQAPFIFIYESGRFLVSDPLALVGRVKDNQYLEVLGFGVSKTVGSDEGLSYTLYEHKGRSEWLVKFQTVRSESWILVRSWPDLMGLLSMLSPIVLAGLIRDYDDDRRECSAHLPTSAVKRSVGSRSRK